MNIKLSHEYFIIKFRYTDDILGRIKTLQDEYKSKIFLIGIKLINIPSEEINFHNIIKKISILY